MLCVLCCVLCVVCFVLCVHVATCRCDANACRLDVPTYGTKEELAQAMATVIDMEVCGFGME